MIFFLTEEIIKTKEIMVFFKGTYFAFPYVVIYLQFK